LSPLLTLIALIAVPSKEPIELTPVYTEQYLRSQQWKLRHGPAAIVLVCVALALYAGARPAPAPTAEAGAVVTPVTDVADTKPIKAHVPCSFRTPGMQYECVDKNGRLQPAGPAAARQEKKFKECMERPHADYACLGEAAKVK
jgi:hypothetical protein